MFRLDQASRDFTKLYAFKVSNSIWLPDHIKHIKRTYTREQVELVIEIFGKQSEGLAKIVNAHYTVPAKIHKLHRIIMGAKFYLGGGA